MIFDSLGIGEMGVVLALAIILIEPKKLGKVMKEFGKFKRKVSQIQTDVKSQLDAITREAESQEKSDKTKNDKTSMRQWGRDQIQTLTATERAEAAQKVLEKIQSWPTYQFAKVVSCFCGTLKELDTEALLRQILLDGKTLVVPYILENESGKIMRMAEIKNLDLDLEEGHFGIREPKKAWQLATEPPSPDLIFVPGTCFDERGGRIGQGLGFYDRYLSQNQGFKAGLGFDVQITKKNLALDPHDEFMNAILTEKRTLIFSASAKWENPSLDVNQAT